MIMNGFPSHLASLLQPRKRGTCTAAELKRLRLRKISFHPNEGMIPIPGLESEWFLCFSAQALVVQCLPNAPAILLSMIKDSSSTILL